MSDIVKAINEMFEFIKELRAEIQKQDEILDILRNNIAYVDIVKEQKETLEITIRVKEEDRPKIKEWLDEEQS